MEFLKTFCFEIVKNVCLGSVMVFTTLTKDIFPKQSLMLNLHAGRLKQTSGVNAYTWCHYYAVVDVTESDKTLGVVTYTIPDSSTGMLP